MNEVLLTIRILGAAAVAALLAIPSPACDGIAFSQGACYSAPIVQHHAYQQQLVLPLNQYVYSQPQAIVLPQKVQIVRPQTVLQLEQVHGYAAPVVLKQQAYAQQVIVQKQVAQRHVQRQVQRQRFLGGRSRSFSLSIQRSRN